MLTIFPGKSKKPRCFGSLSLSARNFYYRHNKKAWMTGDSSICHLDISEM